VAEQMRVQRLRNAGHLPEDKLQDSVGIKPPKLTD
jgi:hypothetical protein